MNLRALVCCRCGGPLANPEVLPALIDCALRACSAAHLGVAGRADTVRRTSSAG